ncbi:MAG: hotdog domain-containing protein [Planctomycetota bacterium]|nr:hotdog domain-containing protein [Planctomycetota bacterium]
MAGQPVDLEGYELAGRKIVMYPDLNFAGRLFGGQLMSWIDEAMATMAMGRMGTKNIVTKKFGEIVFDAPGLLGDVVEIWSRPVKEGTTSLAFDCRVVVSRGESSRLEQIGSSKVVYVALDDAGVPSPWRKND